MSDQTEQIRFCIVGDDSGHNYAIPVNCSEHWYAWLNSEDAELGDDPPSYALRIDGAFTFTDPKTER